MPIVAFLSAILSILAITTYAWAHGPWPYECCHNRDCAEVEARHVRESGDEVLVEIPPGTHPMWPADGRPTFIKAVKRTQLRRSVTGEWGVCISPSGALLCVFPPALGG
jgi:hypothetical protein